MKLGFGGDALFIQVSKNVLCLFLIPYTVHFGYSVGEPVGVAPEVLP